MFGLFVSFILFLFIAIVNIGGCDGGGMGDGSEPTPIPTPVATPEPTPEPTPPPDVSEACSNCPCDFFSVPMTFECWVGDPDTPVFENIIGSAAFNEPAACQLYTFGITVMMVVDDLRNTETAIDDCNIIPLKADTCDAQGDSQTGLTQLQITNCRICLGEYATALNDAGISVIGGPPYECLDN